LDSRLVGGKACKSLKRQRHGECVCLIFVRVRVCVMEKIATKCLYLKRETGSAYTCVKRKKCDCVCLSVYFEKDKIKEKE
jgi:hypothetical protein